MSSLYDEAYFSERTSRVLTSARAVAFIVYSYTRPKAVLDVGCGYGEWLKAFQEQGVSCVHGIDAEFIDRSKLLVPEDCFEATDLNNLGEIRGRYDLVLCLEVAEHLRPGSSENLVSRLVQSAPLVLFSAAVPYQRGTGHMNEQWPHYWRRLFANHGYARLDIIRPAIWQDPRVAWWYQQNLLLFASPAALAEFESLGQAARIKPQMELINAEIFEVATSFRGMVRALPSATRRMLKNRWRRFSS